MNASQLIAAIDIEISRLQQARQLLAGTPKTAKRSPKQSDSAPTTKRHTMSAEGKARIAAAQKKRWAALRRAAR